MADERVNLTVDIDVTGDRELVSTSAKLLAFERVAKRLENRTDRLSGSMNSLGIRFEQTGKKGGVFVKQLTLMERVGGKFLKMARMMMFGVIAVGIEFGISALSLMSLNAAFAVGKLAMKAYNYGMQALAGTMAAVGAAAIAAAAAFKEFQAAQFQFRYKDSAELGSALDQSAYGLRSLYKDATLATFGVQALAGAFAAVSKNVAFGPQSKAALAAMADFAQASGDPGKSLQAAASFIGLLQKNKKFTAEAINAAKQISPEFDKAFKKGSYKTMQAFMDDLMSGKLASEAGVAGQADAISRTLFGQFKAYISTALVEISDVGTRVLEPVKKAMFDIFQGLTRTFRRVSGDLVAFGRGPFLGSLVALTEKLEDFTVVMFRKFLPATEGFWRRTTNFFKGFAVYFREVRDALQPLRDGGSIVIKTFGKPIVEIFRQIGYGVEALSNQAVKYQDDFLAFGDALKSVVQGFFEISRAVREAFARALPIINPVLNAVAQVMKTIASLMGVVTNLGGAFGSAGIVGGAIALAVKGRRSARFERRKAGRMGHERTVSPAEAIYSGQPLNTMMQAGPNPAALTSLSGAMTTAVSGAMTPAANNLTSAASALSGAASALSGAAGITTPRNQMPLKGGTINRNTGQIDNLPPRPPGMSTSEWNSRLYQYRNAQATAAGLQQMPATGYGSLVAPAIKAEQAKARLRDRVAAYAKQRGFGGVQSQFSLGAPAKVGSNYQVYYPNGAPAPLSASNPYMPRGGFHRIIPKSLIDYGKMLWSGKSISGAMSTSGISGAMAPGGAAAGGLKGKLLTGLLGQSYASQGYRGFGKEFAAQMGFAKAGPGGNFATRAITGLKGGNFGSQYRLARSNFQLAKSMGLIDSDAKFSRLKGLKSAAKGSFSGAGAIGSMAAMAGIGALQSRGMVSEEAAGGLQMGASMMSINPMLGLALGAGLTAFSAKTKMGGTIAGAVSGAAIGSMIAGPLGAAAGAALGGLLGNLAARRNQSKLVKAAMSRIGSAQLSSIAAAALEGIKGGNTKKARAALAASTNISRDFRAAADPAARRKVLQPYIDAGIMSGNEVNLAIGDKSGTAAAALDATAKTMRQALTPQFNQFDSIMKALRQSTGMTADAIFDLAMRKNVNLYDTTLTLTDAVQKLGVGMVKTSQQLKDAMKDIAIGSLDVFEQFKKEKEMRDAVEASGQNIRGGDTSMDAFIDYYTKQQDYLSFVNPNSPVANFLTQAAQLGFGANMGKGALFAPGGAFEGMNPDAQTLELMRKAQAQTAAGTATTMSTQLGAMLAESGFQFSDVEGGTRAMENQIKSLINKAAAGDTAASMTLGTLEQDLLRGTALKGKSQEEISTYFNKIFGGTTGTYTQGKRSAGQASLFGFTLEKELSGQLDPFKDVLTAEAATMRQGFMDAIKSGFFEASDTPKWWNTAPDWWEGGFKAVLDKDGNISELRSIGDTKMPMFGRMGGSKAANLRRTMGKHAAFDSMLGGQRSVTSSLRDFNLGSSNSDHATGNAYDLVGQNLGSYSRLVQSAGGFAEFHGNGDSRHLHVVPPPGPMGDTSTSMLSKMSGGGSTNNYSGDTINITVNEASDAQATARAVAAEIMKMQKNWKQRS